MPPTYSHQQTILRAEAAGLAAFALWAYDLYGMGWTSFALLILVPDFSMLGYVLGPRIGAVCYNLGHSLIGPGLLAALGSVTGWDVGLSLALIWAAHIALDRALGYGLKYPSGFRDTHLQRV